MAHHIVAAFVSLAAIATLVDAAWWDVVADGVQDAAGQAKTAAEGAAVNMLEKGENITGAAVNEAESQGCDLKVGEDISEVNATMARQLETDCETQAAKVRYMHEKIYGSCLTMGLWNVNRTLEAQKSKLKQDCLQFLHDAPGDLAGTLARYSRESQKTLTETLGPRIQSAVNKAKETVKGEKATQPQSKFSVEGPPVLLRSGIAALAPMPFLFLALPLLVSLGGFFAWRRGRNRSFVLPFQHSGDDHFLSTSSESEGVV